jgi:phytoene dehydrogenase-like protein
LAVLKDVIRMRLGQSVGGTIRSFIKDPRVAQMLDHYVQYVGSAPDASPAILCSIGHMQSEEGIWYPMGGTRSVPEALVKLGKELGVRYHAGAEIERIILANGKVQGLTTTAGERFDFDAIVSNEEAAQV